jgi:hypothetical protein
MRTLRAEPMFASLATVDDRLSTLLSATSYVGRDVFGPADDATRALAELGDVFVDAAPFPSVRRREDSAVDADVGAYLQARYVASLDATAHVPDAATDGGDCEGLETPPRVDGATLVEADGGESPIDASALEDSALVGSERVEIEGDSVVVPLARRGPPAENWGPVLAVIRSVVEALLRCARTLVRRARTVDERYARDACDGVLGMLASIRDVIVRSGSGVRFVNRRSDTGTEAPMSFATWASERLSGNRAPTDHSPGDRDA